MLRGCAMTGHWMSLASAHTQRAALEGSSFPARTAPRAARLPATRRRASCKLGFKQHTEKSQRNPLETAPRSLHCPLQPRPRRARGKQHNPSILALKISVGAEMRPQKGSECRTRSGPVPNLCPSPGSIFNQGGVRSGPLPARGRVGRTRAAPPSPGGYFCPPLHQAAARELFSAGEFLSF